MGAKENCGQCGARPPAAAAAGGFVRKSKKERRTPRGMAMKVEGRISGGSLYIFLNGELDEYNAAAACGAADGIIEQNLACNRVVFALSGVRFMDSAGIGFLIGRYKKLKRSSTPAYIQSPDPAADKILSMSGIYSLIPKL